MSRIAYLDTSAFLKLFVDEPDSDRVVAAVQEADELFALRLVLTEARVSLERLRRSGRLSQDAFTRCMETVDTYWETQVQILDLSEETYVSAEWMACTRPGLRTLDALHLGAARILRKAVRPSPVVFISCDQRQLGAARELQFPTPIPPVG